MRSETKFTPDQVSWISGRTRLFGIIGHPIEQVRSPEMFTTEFLRLGVPAVMVPIHVLPPDFDTVVPTLMRLQNLDGLIFTIPYKATACGLAHELGPQGSVVGAINALARGRDGRWRGDMFDGIGCVEAFRRRGFGFRGKHVMLIGAGGAGSAIGVAVAHECPASMQLFDIERSRAEELAAKIRQVDPIIEIEIAPPSIDHHDVLLHASPVGMLDDPRLPIQADRLPSNLIVLDAVVKPEMTPLLRLAERSGCRFVVGREMMQGQVDRVLRYFGYEPIART